jgi:AbrB family looped-hinge helix DNA binding protein
MNMLTKLSAKGNVLIPKDVRDHLALGAGATLDVSLSDGTIVLRPITKTRTKSFEEATDELQRLVNYKGPKITDKMMKEAIDRMFREDPQWNPPN